MGLEMYTLILSVGLSSASLRSSVTCTGEGGDPWSSGDHVDCCTGLMEVLDNWNGDGITYRYECILHRQSDYKKIICPFLSTLIHEHALPVRDWYTRAELTDLVVNVGGLSKEEVSKHIHAQFRMLRTLKIDIFDMEGLPDEHQTSSGINDCYSDYSDYRSCPSNPDTSPLAGVRVCPTPSKSCGVPNSDKLHIFWEHFDTNSDEQLSVAELQQGVASWSPQAVDHNTDPQVEGKLDDAFKFLIQTFSNSDSMSKTDFMTVNLQRQYPPNFAFGAGCSVADEYTAPPFQVDGATHSYQFGIKAYNGKWLSAGDGGEVIADSVKHLWTAEVYVTDTGPKVALRSSDTGLWLSADPNGVLGFKAKHSWYEEWSADQFTTEAGSKLHLQSAFGGFLSVPVDYTGPVHIVPKASRDESFQLVYCKLLEPNDALAFV